MGSAKSPGHGPSETAGDRPQARPPSSQLPPPSSLARNAGPWLTCDGAVVVVPWDPGQPHAPLGQVGELQVPRSVRPSWQQREKTPRRTPGLEPARPCGGPSPGHTHGQVPGGRRPPQQGSPPTYPGGSAQGPPLPSGGQGRTKRRLQSHLPLQEHPRMQGTERESDRPSHSCRYLGGQALGNAFH